MKTFNYSFLKENKLSSDILSLYIAIERIKGITQNNKIIYLQNEGTTKWRYSTNRLDWKDASESNSDFINSIVCFPLPLQ